MEEVLVYFTFFFFFFFLFSGVSTRAIFLSLGLGLIDEILTFSRVIELFIESCVALSSFPSAFQIVSQITISV